MYMNWWRYDRERDTSPRSSVPIRPALLSATARRDLRMFAVEHLAAIEDRRGQRMAQIRGPIRLHRSPSAENGGVQTTDGVEGSCREPERNRAKEQGPSQERPRLSERSRNARRKAIGLRSTRRVTWSRTDRQIQVGWRVFR